MNKLIITLLLYGFFCVEYVNSRSMLNSQETGYINLVLAYKSSLEKKEFSKSLDILNEIKKELNQDYIKMPCIGVVLESIEELKDFCKVDLNNPLEAYKKCINKINEIENNLKNMEKEEKKKEEPEKTEKEKIIKEADEFLKEYKNYTDKEINENIHKILNVTKETKNISMKKRASRILFEWRKNENLIGQERYDQIYKIINKIISTTTRRENNLFINEYSQYLNELGSLKDLEVDKEKAKEFLEYYDRIKYFLDLKKDIIDEIKFKEMDKELAYKILGIAKDASEDEIKKVYRNLSRKWHPDKTKIIIDKEGIKKNLAEDIFIMLGETQITLGIK